MAAIKSRGTSVETRSFALFRCLPVPIEVQPREILGKPDFVFPEHRVAVFIDGDFWHGKQWKTRGFRSLQAQFKGIANAEYWIHKIERNVRRDLSVTRRLRIQGWSVIRIWESDIKKNPGMCLRRIVRALHRANEESC